MRSGIKYVIIDVENQSRWVLRHISQESTWKGDPLIYDEANSNNIKYGDSSNLKIVSFDMPYFDELQKFMRVGLKAKVTVVGFKKSLIWSDYMKYIIAKKIKNKTGTRNTMTLTFQMKEGTHNITIGNTEILLPNIDQEVGYAGN